jgi:anti-sigma regulatory factor (Ser/Thr protein kinase)
VSHVSRAQDSIFLQIRGGDDAPKRARRSVRAQLDGQVPAITAWNAALLVSELVSNCVVHANVGPDRALSLEVLPLDDRIRIVVLDPGSGLKPQMLPRDLEIPGGLGLVVVDELCEAWGVEQDDAGPTCVWCELLLEPQTLADTAPVGTKLLPPL